MEAACNLGKNYFSSKTLDITGSLQKIKCIMSVSSQYTPLPVAVILCRPDISRNIGAVCRAMANNNCADLRIVGHKTGYDEEEILRLAIHAGDIWRNARFFEPDVEGLQAAVADCSIVAGTTRRMGEKRKSWGMTPEAFADHFYAASGGLTGIVFGNERTGLSDEELAVCSLALNIPSAPAFPSLNLSHAVQVVCYTLFRIGNPRKYGYERIPYTEIQDISARINEYLCKIGLFRHAGKEDNIRFFQEIIARAGLSATEARRLENIFKKACYIKCQNVEEKSSQNLLRKIPPVQGN